MFKNSKTAVCPFLKGDCIESRCRLWIHVMGKNPQTGGDVDSFDCAIAWMPILMIENSKVNRETGAAIESFRNEMASQRISPSMVKIISQAPEPFTSLVDGR